MRLPQNLIVFDDLERINENQIDFNGMLGTVETLLLNRKNVKVLFIANLEQLSSGILEIWNKYSEKIVNRVYYVDELAANIEFFPEPSDNDMALSFMRRHESKNLRTLQKAYNFYADLLYRLKADADQLCQNDRFLNSLRLACYAVVFELIERTYEQKYQQWEKEQGGKDNYNNIAYKIYNRDNNNRICYNYLSDDPLAAKFVSPLIEYYQNGHYVPEDFIASYQEYITNDKPTYYKSDEKVLEHIHKIKSDLLDRQYTGIPDLVKKADEAFIWCKVMQVEADDIEKLVRDEMPKEYRKQLEKNGKPNFSISSLLLRNVESDRMKTLLEEYAPKEEIIYEEYLTSQVQGALEQNDYNRLLRLMGEIFSVLRNKQNRHEIEKAETFASLLCSEQLLPIGSITEAQYYCCRDVYILAMTYFHETYQHFIQEQEEKYRFNKMFLDRMTNIQREFHKPGEQ